jgi:aspartyl-tRNA(Asn)/glutamyl-tRNA(Gln) amidotransferase subunit A
MYMSIRGTIEKIKTGELTSEDQVKRSLSRIRETQEYNAYISVYEEYALERARSIDQRRTGGEKLGGLAGIPLAVKDNIVASMGKTTWKTNLDEYAMGSSTENSAFGKTLNPLDQSVIAGGSSGGSAAALALDTVSLALGSDTGGSIRQPAACCGVVGMKPTYGRVSRYGLVAYASSLDQIGPMTKTVEDAAYLLNIIAGEDERDQTTAPLEVPDFTAGINQSVQGKVLGLPTEYFGEGLDSRVSSCLNLIIGRLEKEGAVIREISLPHMEYGVAAYYIIATAEASSNLSRYDGVRYTRRSKHVKDVREMYVNSRAEGFSREVKKRILLGTYVLSAGFYDAYYRITDDFNSVFEKCDAVITPTMPDLPAKSGKYEVSPMAAYLGDIYTVCINMAGLPAISVPVSGIGNLPVGMQIIGKPFAEGELFQIAGAVEQLSD